MPDFEINIRTTADMAGAEQTKRGIEATTAAVARLTAETKKSAVESAQFFAEQTRGAEQSAIKARVLANIKATRAGNESSAFGDNSGAADARIQRRLAAQREELGLTRESVPVMGEAAAAAEKFGLSNYQAAAALKQLSHEIPGLRIAAAALKNPYLAAAVAAASMAFAAKRAKDEAVAAAEEQQARLSNSIDLQILKLTSLADAHAKTATATRQHKDALAELERQASGIDAKLAEMDEAAQGSLRVDLAGVERDRRAELAGIAGLPDEERGPKARGINARFDAIKRRREQEALSGHAARLAEADARAKREARDAALRIPGAQAGLEDATVEAARRGGVRTKVPEAITELKAELRRSKDYPTAWEDFLGQITFGVLGRQRSGPFSDVPPTRTPAAIQADIDKFTRAHAGLGGGPEADADEVRRWQEYLNNLQNIERGGGRFRKPLGSALADAATGRTVMGLENQTAANQGIAASLEEAAKALTTAARIARESGSKQEQENTRAEHELRRQR